MGSIHKRIFYIGGSPCSGKSTVAERISKEYGAYYFKVDDFLDNFLELASAKGYPICKQVTSMTSEEIWMREPELQCQEEFLIYEEINEFIFNSLQNIDADFIITEGAAYTPYVMKRHMPTDYISIVPTADFQISHYKEREWVPYILEGCSNKEKAFANWMERDVLFAKQVQTECEANGIPCIVNDGTRTEDTIFNIVRELFHLQ